MSYLLLLWVICYCCEYFGCAVSYLLLLWIFWLCCELFVIAVNILVVLWVICYCCEYFGCAVSYFFLLWIFWLCCELFVIAVNILVLLWVICYCCEYLGLCCGYFAFAVTVVSHRSITMGANSHNDLKSIPWILAEFHNNRIVQSPQENFFNVFRQHKGKWHLVKTAIDTSKQQFCLH